MHVSQNRLVTYDGEVLKLLPIRLYQPSQLVALAMVPERRLMLTVLLDALANMKGGARERYLLSEGFSEVCKMAGVQPQFARLVDARTAKKALAAIREPGRTHDNVIEELYSESQDKQ